MSTVTKNAAEQRLEWLRVHRDNVMMHDRMLTAALKDILAACLMGPDSPYGEDASAIVMGCKEIVEKALAAKKPPMPGDKWHRENPNVFGGHPCPEYLFLPDHSDPRNPEYIDC